MEPDTTVCDKSATETQSMYKKTILTTTFAILAMLATSSAQAAPQKDFVGTWVMRLGDRAVFVLTLNPQGEKDRGVFERPAKYTALADSLFVGMQGGIRRDPVIQSYFAAGVLHLTIQNAANPADQDVYTMQVTGDRALLIFENLPPDVVVQPRHFERTTPGTHVATDWEPNRAYAANDYDIPSTEMKAIVDEDQRLRLAEHIDWEMVNRTDPERRAKTHKLLAAGALHTGKDYEEAALVFQHGDSSSDFLLAHTLAMVAVSKGDAGAIWIASATLDRYLQKIGQPQLFGTQYSGDSKGKWTQDPYDRDTVSDALRQQLGVPTQPAQAEQLKAYSNKKW